MLSGLEGGADLVGELLLARPRPREGKGDRAGRPPARLANGSGLPDAGRAVDQDQLPLTSCGGRDGLGEEVELKVAFHDRGAGPKHVSARINALASSGPGLATLGISGRKLGVRTGGFRDVPPPRPGRSWRA